MLFFDSGYCITQTAELLKIMTFNPTLSLYIPRVVDQWATRERMSPVFDSLNIGQVSRIDFVQKQGENGPVYYQAFVYFSEWYDNLSARGLQERIFAHKSDSNKPGARIVYDDPWYWLILVNANPISEAERAMAWRVANLETHAGTTAVFVNSALHQLNSLQHTTNFLMQNAGYGIPTTFPRQVNTPHESSQTELPSNCGPTSAYPWTDDPTLLPSNPWERDPGYLSAEEQQALAHNIWKARNDELRNDLGLPPPGPPLSQMTRQTAVVKGDTSDEDEGLTPFVHNVTPPTTPSYSPSMVPPAIRRRSSTEESELETRRHQKLPANARALTNETNNVPNWEPENHDGIIRTDKEGSRYRWNARVQRWFCISTVNEDGEGVLLFDCNDR